MDFHVLSSSEYKIMVFGMLSVWKYGYGCMLRWHPNEMDSIHFLFLNVHLS
jgi:hypothetical protein